MNYFKVIFILICAFILFVNGYKKKEDKSKCPQVKGARNFDLNSILGSWYIIQYYATSEEDIMYKCMRAVFSMPTEGFEIEMNFTYSFADDPVSEVLDGNITWTIPDVSQPEHWVHAEDSYEGVYNTYVLDCDGSEWGLLLHCAEKPKSPRYLTSLMLSRKPTLPPSVISFLRDKLPRYDITLDYMFEMGQSNCEDPMKNLHYASKKPIKQKKNKHPLHRMARFAKNRSKAKRK